MSAARVLIVDDDRSFADAVAIYLEDHGFRVVKAYDGGDAIQAARSQSFDLAVLDLHLPDADGSELAGELRRYCPTTATLMVSSDDSPETLAKCLGADVQMFMAKPLMPKQLLENVCLLCGQSGTPASARSAGIGTKLV